MAWLDIPEQDEDSTATRTRNSVFAEALDDISFFLFGIKKLNPNRLVLASNGVQLEADHDHVPGRFRHLVDSSEE